MMTMSALTVSFRDFQDAEQRRRTRDERPLASPLEERRPILGHERERGEQSSTSASLEREAHIRSFERCAESPDTSLESVHRAQWVARVTRE